MTKQEEIGKGLYELRFAGRYGKYYKLGYPDVDAVLRYLHNNDVVVKMERELPICNPHFDEKFRMGWFACGGAIKNAGYVAVEPLIEVRDGS